MRDVEGAPPTSNFCASEDAGRICHGDSGSFVGRLRPGSQQPIWEVIAVTSYATSTGRGDQCEGPAGFARASMYAGWIKKYSTCNVTD